MKWKFWRANQLYLFSERNGRWWYWHEWRALMVEYANAPIDSHDNPFIH